MATATVPDQLPPLPTEWDDGYDWLNQLSGGWHEIALYGSEGWDLGHWPYVIVAHFNGHAHSKPGVFGQAVYVESDITVKQFGTRAERDRATGETAVFYWKMEDRMSHAPQSIDDPRVHPYRG